MALKSVLRQNITTPTLAQYTPLTGKAFSGELNLCNLDSAAVDVVVRVAGPSGGTQYLDKIKLAPAGTLGNSARVRVAISSADAIEAYHDAGASNYSVNLFGDEYTA